MTEREKVLATERKIGYSETVEFVYSYLLACLIDDDGRVDLQDILKEFPALEEELDIGSIELCWQSAKTTYETEYLENIIMDKKLEIVADKLLDELGL